jgi:mono/diheme cytochrome c family protein
MNLLSALVYLVAGIIISLCMIVPPHTTAASMLDTNLIWDSETKATNIVAGANEAHFTFNFTNVLSTNVTIISVRPSCGCTTAQLPPLPWVIAPGTNGQIGIKVNIAAKSGTLSKTITVGTDKDSKTLSVKITIDPALTNTMSGIDRAKNVTAAQADRQAVFSSDCASCHVTQGKGKFGKELYDADCAICHEGPNRATMVPNLHDIAQTTDAEFWRTWISYGRPHSLMPAFATTEGGPLTDEQIATLTDYLRVAMPSKSN